MNVYDTANKLAEEIKQSEEYINFKKYKNEIESNNELKTQISEFEKKRQELQMLTIRGENLPEEKASEVQNMYGKIGRAHV